MRIRLISAAVALPIFFIIIYFMPLECVAAANAVITAMSAYEILNVSHFAKKGCPEGYITVITAAVLPICLFLKSNVILAAVVLTFIMLLFALGFKNMERISFENICGCFFAGTVVPFCLSGIIRLTALPDGRFYVLYPFAIAWLCDTGAYFIGKLFGKHKLCPTLSPKKTVEGAIGGILFSVCGTSLVNVVYSVIFNKTPDYVLWAVIAAVLSVFAQFGDLAMSFIKRNYSVKDYGDIMPGHGGILDRFDSVIFVTPLVEALILYIPNLLR